MIAIQHAKPTLVTGNFPYVPRFPYLNSTLQQYLRSSDKLSLLIVPIHSIHVIHSRLLVCGELIIALTVLAKKNLTTSPTPHLPFISGVIHVIIDRIQSGVSRTAILP